jgi:hypothetical protein
MIEMLIQVIETKIAMSVIRSRTAISPGDLRKVLRTSHSYQSTTTALGYLWNGITPLSQDRLDSEKDEKLNKSTSLT